MLISLLACIEIHPITPPSGEGHGVSPGENTSCQAPSISQNIIGTWHFESTYNLNVATGAITTGTITFDVKGNISDPDSLFENHLSGKPVLAKTYEPEVESTLSSYSGKLFIVYQKIATGRQVCYFTQVSNECDRIHLRQFQSGNNGIGFILNRL
jgi:hypothetical protein